MELKELTSEQLRQFEAIVDEFEKCRGMSQEERDLLIRQIMSDTFMDLRCDWAFKHLLQDKEILKMLLNDVLPEKIDNVKLLPNEVDRFFSDDKNATMDVICHSHEPAEKTFIVEIQRKRQRSLRERMLYYGAASLTKQVKRGEPYRKLQPVYVVCFLDEQYQHSVPQLVYRYSMREETTNEAYSDLLRIYFFELPRLQKKDMTGLSPMEGWLFLLRNLHKFAEIPEGMDKRFDPVVKAARMKDLPNPEQLQYFRAMISEDTKQDYYLGGYDAGMEAGFAEGMEKGIEKGMEEGMVKGKIEERRSNVNALLAAGVLPETISAALGISLEELQRMKDL